MKNATTTATAVHTTRHCRWQTSPLVRSSTLTPFIVDENLAVISAVMLVVFYHTLCTIGPLCENVASFRKLEVHNVS